MVFMMFFQREINNHFYSETYTCFERLANMFDWGDVTEKLL